MNFAYEMPKSHIKPEQKGKRQTKLSRNINPSLINEKTSIPNNRDKITNYLPAPNVDPAQGSENDRSTSILQRQVENYELFEKGLDYNLDLLSIKEKISELVNQRDDLKKYERIVSSVYKNQYSKHLNQKSLEIELSDLKSMIGMLQTGLNIILDEHSAIKSLVIDQTKDIYKLLERSLGNSSQQNRQNSQYCFNNLEKYFLPLKSEDKNKNTFGVCKNSSFFNNSNINLLKTISKINLFRDSQNALDKFRQQAELKIIVEILQKYSKILSDEFTNLNSSVKFPNKEPCNFFHKDNQSPDFSCKSHGECPLFAVENHLSSDNIYHESLSIESEENNLKFSSSLDVHRCLRSIVSKDDLSKEIVIKDQTMHSNNEFISNPSRKFEKHAISSSKYCIENEYNMLPGDSSHKKPDSKKLNNINSHLDYFGCYANKLNKRKILFLSDSHGRCCSQFLQDELGSEFSVISVVKPDAFLEEIIQDFQHLATNFSHNDYVIVFAGLNDLLKNNKQMPIEFERSLTNFQHTNIIFSRIPLLFNRPLLNSQIRRVNNMNSRKIFELSRKNANILPMPNFTFFSRDCVKLNFNKIGRKTFCKVLAKIIISDCYIKSQKSCFEFQYNKSYNSTLSNKGQTDSKLDKNSLNSSISSADLLYEPTQFVSGETTFQLKKSTHTQTSLENLCELEKSQNFKLNFIANEAKNISTSLIENIESCPQCPTIEQYSNVSRVVKDFCCHKSEDCCRKGFFAGIFMKNNHTNMTTIKELLGQGDIPKPRKNFIQENVKRLKELKLEKTNKLGSQRSKNLQPLAERRNAQTMVSSSRLAQRHSVSSRPTSQPSPSPPLRSRRNNKHVMLDTQPPILEVDDSPKGYRSQGCQTLSSKQLENLYDEGVIRYPSVRDMGDGRGEGEGRNVREMALQTEVLHPPSPPSAPPPDDGLHWDEERKLGDKDYVKMNATVPDPRRHKTADPSSTDPTRAPPTYQRGVVPKYLREQKKEMERERINKAKDDECPEGHIQLPDDIKQKHLTTLRQNYAELVSQLNQLPVSTDTLRTRTRKKQIESDLDRIEAAIALFSREKVFVKADS